MKKAIIYTLLLAIFLFFWGCNYEKYNNCVSIGNEKYCLQDNDEIISINTNFGYLIGNKKNLIYFEGVSQSGGVDIEDSLNKARIDAALKMIDFFGVKVGTYNGNVKINYGSISEVSLKIIKILNSSLEYLVFRRNRGNFYEIHTILIYIPGNKKFIPIYEDEFSKKLWQYANQ